MSSTVPVSLHFNAPFSAQRGERCSKQLDASSRLAVILSSLRAEVDRLTAKKPEDSGSDGFPPPANRRGLHVEVLHRSEGQATKLPAQIEQPCSRQGHDTPPGGKAMSVFERRVRSLEGTPIDLSSVCFWRGAIIVPTVQQPEMGYNSLSHITIDYFGIKRGGGDNNQRGGGGLTPAQGAQLSKHLAEYAVSLLPTKGEEDRSPASPANPKAQAESSK